MTKSGQEILRKAEAVAKGAGILIEPRLLVIDTMGQRIPEMIAADAESWPADLLVICPHGSRGLSHLFLGSVAEGGGTRRHETGVADPRKMTAFLG